MFVNSYAQATIPTNSCQSLFDQDLIFRRLMEKDVTDATIKFWNKYENRPKIFKRLFEPKATDLHKFVYRLLYKNYLKRLKESSLSNLDDTDNSVFSKAKNYLSLKHQAQLLAAVEAELFFREKPENRGNNNLINFSSLYRELVTEDTNRWKTLRNRSTEVLLSGLSFYYFHLPTPLTEVQLVNSALRNSKNDSEMSKILDDIELQGPTPENISKLKMKLGTLPEIEQAINFALRAFKIFIIGTVLYYLILNGGLNDIRFAFGLSQSFDIDEIEKTTEENFNSTTWIDINESAWIEYVRSHENRDPTPAEIESLRKGFEN